VDNDDKMEMKLYIVHTLANFG